MKEKKMLIILTEENRQYLKVYSGLKDVSLKSLINTIIEEYRAQHPLNVNG